MALSRKEQMRRIRSFDTKPEVAVREALQDRKIGYVPQLRTPAGTADFGFPAVPLAVFVDGCQWHGCPDHYARPRTNQEKWQKKLGQNVERDMQQTSQLEEEGWRVLRFWEHEIALNLDRVVKQIAAALNARPRSSLSWRAFSVKCIDAERDLERWSLVELRNRAPARTLDRTRFTSRPKIRRRK